MIFRYRQLGTTALSALATGAVVAILAPAEAQQEMRSFNIPAQPLSSALIEFSRQSEFMVVVDPALVAGKQAPALSGDYVAAEAIALLLSGSGLTAVLSEGGFVVSGGATPSQPGAAAAAPSDEEVLVTAQKRTEAIQDVPASIAAIGGAELADRGIASINDLQFAVPSLYSGTFVRGTPITIRGVGASPGGGSPGVAVSIDGVFQTQTSTADLAQFDLQRVEVLRGPQGTLYGRNASAGVVNFITRAPTSELEGYLMGGYGSYDRYRLQGVLNVPIGENLRARLSVDYSDQQRGFVENDFPGAENLSGGEALNIRLRLSADVTPDLEVDVAGAHSRSKGPWEYYTRTVPIPSATVAANPHLVGVAFPLSPWRTSENDPIEGDREYSMARATLTWQLPFAELRSITGYQQYDYDSKGGDGLPVSHNPYTAAIRDSVFSQEFNLVGESDLADWSAGVFYLDESLSQSLHFTFPRGQRPLPPGAFIDLTQHSYDTTAIGVFADATFHITDKLNAIIGGRYSRDEVEVDYENTLGIEIGGNRQVLTRLCPRQTETLDFESFTPRLGLQYEIDEDKSMYATFARGFKAGGVNANGCQNPYNPEEITSYEVGFKSVLADRKLTFNAAAFFYEYSDFQLGQIVGTAFIITNASSAQVKGLELETVWTPDDHWTVNANLSLIDATYTEFTNLDSFNPAAGIQDLAGHILNRTPKVSANLGIAYRADLQDYGWLTARVDASYRSRTYFREFNTSADAQEAYTVFNANLIWDSPDERYSVRVYASNFTNEPYYTGISGDAASGRTVVWGDPRQFGIEVTANFP